MTLPRQPSLEYDRKQARRLLKQLRAGDADALRRLTSNHPRFPDRTQPDLNQLKLADAQLVIAREYGFASWPRWKQFVEMIDISDQEKSELFLKWACSGSVAQALRLLQMDASFTNTNLCAAAASGNLDAVKNLLDDSINDNQGPLDTTPLVYACQSRLLVTSPERRNGIVASARLLLNAGANPNRGFYLNPEEQEHFQSAIYGAAGIANDPEMTRMLLEAGADPSDDETLYHTAEFADTRCLEALMEYDPDQDRVDYCLGRALDFDKPDPAWVFVRQGADVDRAIPWFLNRTHLMKAIAEHCDEKLLEAMIKQSGNLEKTDDEGNTPYCYAIRFGNDQAARYLEANGADTSKVGPMDFLGQACMQNDADRAKELVSKHPDILGQFDSRLPTQAVRLNRFDALTLMFELGVSFDPEQEMPALHSAAYWGQLDMVKHLINLGASLTELNNKGGTALGAAIACSMMCHHQRGGPMALPPDVIDGGPYAQIVEFLLEKGSSVPEQENGNPAVIEVLQRYVT